MQVDVVDLGRIESRALQSVAQGQLGADAVRMGSGHVICIAGFAITEQARRIRRGVDPLQQRKTSCFADRDTVALGVERPARFGRYQFERVEAE